MSKETELCFYALVGDSSGFDQAVSQEIHEQYEHVIVSPDGLKNKQRIRATTRDGVVIYDETIKLYSKDENILLNAHEPTVPITAEYFEAWKKLFPAKGVNKIRYVFISKEVELEAEGQVVKLPEVKYEVDIFLNANGQRSRWCKIDIEIDGILAFLKEQHPDIKQFDTTVKLSSLPIKPEHAFSGVTEDEEQKKAIASFWEAFAIRTVSAQA